MSESQTDRTGTKGQSKTVAGGGEPKEKKKTEEVVENRQSVVDPKGAGGAETVRQKERVDEKQVGKGHETEQDT